MQPLSRPSLRRRRPIRWRGAAGLLVLAWAAGLGAGVAGAAGADAVELMRRVERQDDAPDEQVVFTMQLIDAAGRVRERTGTVLARRVAPGARDQMRLIRFRSPADIEGSGVLTIEHSDRDNDQWLYLPAYHTTRRIPPANRGDRYMGTDFLYEDITRERLEEYRYTTVGDEALGAVRCVVVEAVPVAEELARDTAYAKKLLWIDPERNLVLRVDYYARDGRQFKRFTVTEVERVAGRHRPRAVRMEDFARQHATVVTYSDRKIGAGVPERYFTERYLRSGR